MPERAHSTDAGLDLRTRNGFWIAPGSTAIADTGIHMQIPHGMYGSVQGKSGIGFKYDIFPIAGTIDEGYTGSIKVKLVNIGKRYKYFKKGDKIAQLVIQPYLPVTCELADTLEETERGDNGFGSTGR